MSDDAVPMEASVQSPPATISQEERMYAAACHFAGLPIFITVAMANLIAPLVIWLIKKDTMPFVDEHGKESLNFQITLLIAYAIAGVLVCLGIGIVVIGVLVILQIVFPLIAGIAAYDGRPYKYPMTIRMIR
jgi:uncharacterized Tic20 family protein